MLGGVWPGSAASGQSGSGSAAVGEVALGVLWFSTSVVPSQKPIRRDLLAAPGVSALKVDSFGCAPGIVAVTPRKGSVSSCSGDGSARGDMSTREAAQRIAATEACTSDIVAWEWLKEGFCPAENELRNRCAEEGSRRGNDEGFGADEITGSLGSGDGRGGSIWSSVVGGESGLTTGGGSGIWLSGWFCVDGPTL